MPLRRRRPLMAAAMVGGVAHHAAKRGAEAGAEQAQQDQQYQQYQQYAPPPPAPAAGGMSADALDKLKQLAELHTQGILTDAEFEVQKQKILQGM
jgi:hypothetical protein